MKILILGGTGMLGHKLNQVWQDKFDVYTTIRTDFSEVQKYGIFPKDKTFENIEVENLEEIRHIVKNLKPNVIFNAIGIIKQQTTIKNKIKIILVNSIFPHQLLEISEQNDSRLIQISTDCVFDGKKGNYKERDFPSANDLYGRSKVLGEINEGNALTIRTSIIGRELRHKHGLVEWFLSNKGGEVDGFSKAVFSGFPTVVFAEILIDIILNRRHLRGLYHISSNPINKFDLLNLINQAYGAEIAIKEYSEFEIDRSLNSNKFRTETNFIPKNWDEMIRIMAKDKTSHKILKNN